MQKEKKPERCGWCQQPKKADRLHIIGFNPLPGEEVYVCEICLNKKHKFEEWQEFQAFETAFKFIKQEHFTKEGLARYEYLKTLFTEQ